MALCLRACASVKPASRGAIGIRTVGLSRAVGACHPVVGHVNTVLTAKTRAPRTRCGLSACACKLAVQAKSPT